MFSLKLIFLCAAITLPTTASADFCRPDADKCPGGRLCTITNWDHFGETYCGSRPIGGPYRFTGYGCAGDPLSEKESTAVAQIFAARDADKFCAPSRARRVTEFDSQLIQADCRSKDRITGYSSTAYYVCE